MHPATATGRRDRLLLFGVLCLSTAASFVILAFRAYYGGTTGYAMLVWNLLLAWIPFWLALPIDAMTEPAVTPLKASALVGPLLALGFFWLLFFPNAPYLVTDFIHLHPSRASVGRPLPAWLLEFSPRHLVPLWYDVILVTAFAWNGLLLGFMSLYLVQRSVRRLAGTAWGWVTVVAVALLSGFGISLGRFERWNSWDLFSQPTALLADAFVRVLNPFDYPRTTGVTLLFASFLLLGYLALVALMKVHRNETAAGMNTRPVA